MKDFTKVVYRNERLWEKSFDQEEIMMDGRRVNPGDHPKSINTFFQEITNCLDGGPSAYAILEVERVISVSDPMDCILWFTFVNRSKFLS